jgi:hypothetical protein
MQVDWAVELGSEDDRLEMPWASSDGSTRYYDLKRQPELLLNIEEAHHNQELGEFLASTNSNHSVLETAKCDTWLTNELNEEEAVYQAEWKFGSYVDLLFSAEERRHSFPDHERFADAAGKLLKRAPEMSAAAEFIVRRCTYHMGADAKDGFYLTFYLYGYGSDEDEARQRWGIAMKLVENALLQLSAAERRAAQ